MAQFDFPASPTDGQQYTANGVTFVWSAADTAWKGQGSQVPLTNKMRVLVYSGPGTFAYVKPVNLKALLVEIQSAGGGGGGAAATSATQTAVGGGGGGGSYMRKLYQADELAASESLVLGACGVGGVGATAVAGTNGVSCTFKGITVGGGGGGSHGAVKTAYSITGRGGYGSVLGGPVDAISLGTSGEYGINLPHGTPNAFLAGIGGGAGLSGGKVFYASATTTLSSAKSSASGVGGSGSGNGFSQAAAVNGADGGDAYAVFTEYYAENDTTSGGGGGDYLPLSGGTLTGALRVNSDIDLVNMGRNMIAPGGQTLWDIWRNDSVYTEYAWRLDSTSKSMLFRRYDGLASQAYRNLITITPTSGQDADISLNNLTMQRGIIFPASQVVSADPNALDDSERGSFTPSVDGTTAAGSGTYTFRGGRYTKIGNKVFFELIASWTAHTGTGNIKISGLPFASIVGSWGPVVSIHADSLTFSGQLSATIPNGQVYVSLATIATAAASGAVAMDTSATLNIAGHYTAA